MGRPGAGSHRRDLACEVALCATYGTRPMPSTTLCGPSWAVLNRLLPDDPGRAEVRRRPSRLGQGLVGPGNAGRVAATTATAPVPTFDAATSTPTRSL